MFTGLVEEMGTISKVQHGAKSAKLTIKAKVVLDKIKLGDSIAVNGICLTAVWYSQEEFAVEVMDETLKKTNLGNLAIGHKVNLERALSLGDRLGGHLVSGHVDGVGEIIHLEKVDIANLITIKAPAAVTDFTIDKGSIAIDGISLTVVDCATDSFTVSLIPHTAAMTTLGFKKIGDKVNLEADLIGKYVAKYIAKSSSNEEKATNKNSIDTNFLAEHGFM